MSKNILYPGTFDPITYGHIDLIKKALKIADKVIIAISSNGYKNYLFDANERLLLVKKSLYSDLKMKPSKVEIMTFNSLTTDLCKKKNLKLSLEAFEQFQILNMNSS